MTTTTLLSRGKADPETAPVSLETDARHVQVAAMLREKATRKRHLQSRRDALLAPRPHGPEDTTASALARAEALLDGEPHPAGQEESAQALLQEIATIDAEIVDLRLLEQREFDRVTAAVNIAASPSQRRGIDQMVDGLLQYNAGAEAERAVRDGLTDAGVRISLRPIVVHELGLLREEYSGISLLVRELKEYDLLSADREKRAIAAGWRP
jgi:hypothetical protein